MALALLASLGDLGPALLSLGLLSYLDRGILEGTTRSVADSWGMSTKALDTLDG
jgi:hypothetical protein